MARTNWSFVRTLMPRDGPLVVLLPMTAVPQVGQNFVAIS